MSIAETPMLKRTKWLDGIAPGDPVSRAARRAIRGRLRAVVQRLPLAARLGDVEPEHVHQLRVASRRAGAALAVFNDALPSRRTEWMLRQLKRVRRTAGALRDLDVWAERLAAESSLSPTTRSLLSDLLRLERRRALPPIVDLYRRLRRKRFPRRANKLVDRIQWRGPLDEPTYGVAARCGLRILADDWFRDWEADFSEVDNLHALRISGKRLRYAMELFAAAFEPAFKDRLYANVERILERLGEINDRAAAVDRCQRWAGVESLVDASAALSECIELEARELASRRREFLDEWTPQCRDELQRGFAEFLGPPRGD